MTGLRAETWDPAPVTSRAWTVDSFLADAGLAGRFLFTIDFDERGTAWLATAMGLIAYDGYEWRRYGPEDGLPTEFVRCATIARDGRVWIGTDIGIVIFDGSVFRPLPGGERLAGPNVRRIVEDNDGTMWICSDKWLQADAPAGLTAVRGDEFTVYREADGLPSDYVSDYFRDSSGRQFVLTREGLAQWQDGRWIQPLAERGLPGHDAYMWSIVESPSTGVMVATNEWFFVLEDDRWSVIRNGAPGLAFPKLCSTANGEVLTLSNLDSKSFLGWNGEGFDRLTDPVRDVGGVEFVASAPDGSIWAIGIDVLFRWSRNTSEWTEYTALPPPAFAEADGTGWFIGDGGVVRYADGRFESIPDLPPSLAAGRTGDVWGWDAYGIVRHRSGITTRYAPAVTGLAVVERIATGADDGAWFVGRDADRAIVASRFDGEAWRATTIDPSSEPRINAVRVRADGALLVYLVRPPRGPHTIVSVRGDEIEILPAPRDVVLFGGGIHLGADERLWLHGEFGAFCMTASGWARTELPGRNVVAMFNDGPDLWFTYTGLSGGRSGMSRLRDAVRVDFEVPVARFTTLDPERGAFSSGEHGLVRPPQIADGLPLTLSVPIAGDIGSAIWTGHDEVWTQIGETVARYRSDGQPPRTVIVRSATETIAGEPLEITVEARERFRPRGSGRFTYSWRVDAGLWSPFAPLVDAKLPLDLPPGPHRLEVRARDEGLDVDPVPASVSFKVQAVPLAQRAWFWPTVIAIFLVAFATGAVAIISRFRIQRYAHRLESKVRARTTGLRASEERFRRLVEYATDALFLFGVDGRIVEVNEAACKSLGYTRAELLGMTMADIDGRWTPYALTALAGRLADGGPLTTEGEHRRRDGSEFPVEAHTGLLQPGDSTLILSLVRDVTERKQVEFRHRRMMDELDHRVKNNLATVIALATQTLARSDSLETFRESFISRIHSMARVHEDLARSGWRSIDLGETIRRTLDPHAEDETARITTAGPPVRLAPHIASPLALAIHELATNAAKHGALSCADGQLEVKWQREGGRALLSWVERGGPSVTNPDPGFGIRLVQGLMEREIRGEAELSFEREGLNCTLSIPCEDAGTETDDEVADVTF